MVSKLLPLKRVWKTVIGLEIHAQLNTKTKLFSIAPNKFHSPPNTNVAYFDMATPGTLPIINGKCVELAILAATVLKCEINYCSEFDRKHYFYGDMPAGYQITQYRKPIGRNGKLAFHWNSSQESQLCKDVRKSEVRIIEIHLEQDSGKSLHDYDRNISMIDLNRAGVGLLEVVTDCQFENSLEAVGFVKELRNVFSECGICNGHMEEGELRVDANVSVKLEESNVLGERSEVKNINSLRGVWKAIEFESRRQIELLESGQPVVNETRWYDPVSESTISMRDKENIQDYRYFPEPNLPPLGLHRTCQRRNDLCLHPHTCVPCIQTKLSNFIYPNAKNELLVSKFSMSFHQCNTILSEPGLYEFMVSVCNFVPAIEPESQTSWFRQLGIHTLSVLLGELRARHLLVESCPVSHENFAELVTMANNSKINSNASVQILKEMFKSPDKSPTSIMNANKWEQINDPGLIENIVREFIRNNQKALHDYRAGNKRVSRYFKKTIKSENKDLINVKILNSIVDQVLEEKS